MNNYQLYRTNTALGGQLQWDLVISKSENMLYISEFHISPISSSIPFVNNQNNYLLNNDHLYNVKDFYSKISSYFYEDCLPVEFTDSLPLINDGIQYSNIYDMGCKRSSRFFSYKKQFEFLCPVWIEKLEKDISFKIDIKNSDNSTVLYSNILKIQHNHDKYHNKFVDYFTQYINASKISNGNDDLINLSFDNKTMVINGLDLKNGLITTKQNDCHVNNFLLVERPLMETDSLLTNIFKQNEMICTQLFNFNLCFNIEDILPKTILELLRDVSVNVSVSVIIDNTILEKRDFYTNYENIADDNGNNILNYLHDYEYINTINKNKFNPVICHWSLANNENYIFNTYKGFNNMQYTDVESGTVIKIDKTINYVTANSPDTSSTEITYYTTDIPVYLMRYDGKLKPKFINNGNLLYYKDIISIDTIKNTVYNNSNFISYPAIYPSLNY